ncbi:hypothetical protein U27_01957 [Candidatus Vecturithrix granuli]|uniref:Uncharacterized protein n=1 Tax=Vecturithrix granuli TaxID=1499967 RepID=A0A0S6WB50_VECG1|nr:hypothetical protein U27_01957 [Candidatus Vecturithrix granuli]
MLENIHKNGLTAFINIELYWGNTLECQGKSAAQEFLGSLPASAEKASKPIVRGVTAMLQIVYRKHDREWLWECTVLSLS